MGTLLELSYTMKTLMQALNKGVSAKLLMPGMQKISFELSQLDQEFDRLQVQNGIMRGLIVEAIKQKRRAKEEG